MHITSIAPSIATTPAGSADWPEIRLGLVHWNQADGVLTLLTEIFRGLGCQVTPVMAEAKLPEQLDAVFVFGPNGSLVPLVNQLLALPPAQRPLLVLHHSEQLPNPRLPEWLRRTAGVTRSRLERFAYAQNDQAQWRLKPHLRWLTTKFIRFRYYGDLYWLRQNDMLGTLAFASAWTSARLCERGFDVITVPAFGYPESPEWGADLGVQRDIDVLWLGKVGSRRRARLLQRIRTDLQQRGIKMMVIDGVEHPYVHGEARTVLLNRTKVVLNILREPWDENAGRYYLAGLNRALIVTEPTLPHHPPFVPGVHLVEAPIEQMADTICYYLTHGCERERIAEQAYQLVTTDMAIEHTVAAILTAIKHKRQPH